MAVPDDQTFGRDSVTFGDVRKALREGNKKKVVVLLDKRINHYLIEMSTVLVDKSPFPLAVMCCVAIETLGQLLYTDNELDVRYKSGRDPRKKLTTNQLRFEATIARCFRQNRLLIDPFSPEQLKRIRPNIKFAKSKYLRNVSSLIYGHFRNSLVHGFHASGIYLNDKVKDIIEYNNKDNFYELNPNAFWNEIVKAYRSFLKEAKDQPTGHMANRFVSYARSLVA